jgi:hypothetical protein
MARPRKILARYGPIDYGSSKSFNFDDETWAVLARQLPIVGDPAALRREVEHVCAFVVGFAKINKIGEEAASASLAAAGNAKRGALERFVAALQEAEAAWQEMQTAGFRSSAIIGANNIERLAAGAQELLRELRDTARQPVETWPILVRCVDAAFRRAGCQPTAHKRGYEGAQPTWFQDFMWNLNDRLPDGVRRRSQGRAAFDAAVAGERSKGPASKEEKKLIEAVEGLVGLANELATQQSGEK